MSSSITVGVGRDKPYYVDLYRTPYGTETQERVVFGALNKAQIRIGSTCVSSDDSELDIINVGGYAVLQVSLGRVIDTPGLYRAYVTLYDSGSPEGIDWGTFLIEALVWPVCEAE